MFYLVIVSFFYISSCTKRVAGRLKEQNRQMNNKHSETVKEEDNIIEDLSYISIDAKGNEYILNAEYGKDGDRRPIQRVNPWL